MPNPSNSSGSKVPYDKPALSYSAQLQQLIERGMSISDPARALHYLQQVNYYRLTSYWLPFQDNQATHNFKPDTEFEHVLDLYVFDRELRLLLLDAIERIEVGVRTKFAYHLAQKHGAHAHLDSSIFRNSNIHRQAVDQLKHDVNDSKEEFIRHFKAKYSEPLPPIWAVVELMSLGQLSRWYSNLKHRQDLKKIADQYNMGGEKLKSYLHHLSVLRNLCAHHSRVWNRQFVFAIDLPTGPLTLTSSLNPRSGSTRKLYNTLVITAFLLDQISPSNSWKARLEELMNEYGIDEVQMGFPNNWQQLPIWR